MEKLDKEFLLAAQTYYSLAKDFYEKDLDQRRNKKEIGLEKIKSKDLLFTDELDDLEADPMHYVLIKGLDVRQAKEERSNEVLGIYDN